jgi:glycosyltransferase involved in cell wall biosynthesis
MKHLCIISCPVDTFSGYGSRSRDIVKAIIDLKKDEWDIKIAPQRWGNCPWGFINDHEETWGFLKQHFLNTPQLPKQPEVWIQITVPNEFQSIGKYNIGITAGIETTICDPSWIEGINRMNLTLVSSEHAKKVFQDSKFEKRDQKTNQLMGNIQLEKPVEVLFEGADLNLYKVIEPKDIQTIDLDNIKESFCYLLVGHWMQGQLGEDRKNVGLLVKAFYETFKNKKNKPALILKSSGAGSSYMDRNQILDKINQIKETVNAKDLPNVYLLHGDLTDKEINELYNHSKVKAMVSLTKGEGYGRPLLEFSLIKKPIIASKWSGHLDFLNEEFVSLVPGELKQVHPSAVVPNIILAESQWFTPDVSHVGHYLRDVFENYKDYKEKANRQSFYAKTNFSWDKMKEKVGELFSKHIPEFPKQVQLKLPQLKKIELPKLKKVEPETVETK